MELKLMFTGSIVALVTPMDEKGNICQFSLKKIIDYHVFNGTTAIVSVGTTGEASTLDYEEHIKIVLMTLDLADNRIPIIAGTGSNATSKAVKLTQRFNDSGIAACLTVTPYYNCPTQEGLFQHFKMISEHTDLPQILYNIPSRTGCNILPETVGRLAKIKNIIGIKEATGNLRLVSQLKKLVPDDFILLSGDDSTALDFIQLGGDGVISVTANIAAKNMTKICQLAASGLYQEARMLNYRLMPLHNKLFTTSNPTSIKWACKTLGLIKTDTLRLPMTSITTNDRREIITAMKYAGLI